MKIHEYQAKQILATYNILIPKGGVASTAAEAREIAANIGGNSFVVKAQVHAGGRGKGGGIKMADSPLAVEAVAKTMLGSRLVTQQTNSEGKLINKVLVEEAIAISQEMYLGIAIDRSRECPVIVGSKEGGVEIEELAKRSPEKIIKEWIDPRIGLRPFKISKIFFDLEVDDSLSEPMIQLIGDLYRMFIEKDCSLAEINPLIVTKAGQIVALDAKLDFDDNALYRHRDVAEMKDIMEEDPLDAEASKYKLNYIRLGGNVGCMVNGAGLAMATVDSIKLAGGLPANFLDVGGGATVEMVKKGLKILISDLNVKSIFVNIFGGFLHCDTVARGLIEANSEEKLKVPIVVRMVGTNVDIGRKLLKESGLEFSFAETMEEGVQKVIASIGS